MIKYVIALGATLIFSSFMFFSIQSGKDINRIEITPAHEKVSQAETIQNYSSADTSEIPDVIKIPSSVGEIVFPHRMHIEDQEIECVECHHQINATKLNTPHPEYFKSSWIKCNICHNGSDHIAQKVYTCSKCHHSTPDNITDETLSAKVVIHKKCWSCHDIGTGAKASESCSMCHSGPKTKK